MKTLIKLISPLRKLEGFIKMDENNSLNDDLANDNIKSFSVPKDKNKNSEFYKNILIIFCGTLVVGVILISTLLKSASPSVDLEIGDNPVASMNQRGDEDYEDNIRMQIDERLKMIQNEEEMPGVSAKGYETDEEIIKRLRAGENSDSSVGKKNSDKQSPNDLNLDIQPVSIPIANAPKVNYLSKIYIGQFSDVQKAVEMQSNILDSGLNINTVIKEVNGYYTIQAGVFSSYEAAKNIAEQINNAGFSAKVVREIR